MASRPTDELEADAVRLVLAGGKSLPQVARDLDLTESSLRNRVERVQADKGKGRPGVLTSAEREELAVGAALLAETPPTP